MWVQFFSGEQDMPNKIEKESGNKQRAKPGEALPKPVVIIVRDDGGHVVPNIPVEFLPDDDGKADPPKAKTGADGKAESNWTLGSELGTQRLKVKSASTENRVKFKAFAKETIGNEIEKVSGNWQEGPIGQPLPEPLVVLVTNPAYDPVPGVALTFTPSCGSCNPPQAATNAAGLAETIWTPGPEELGLVRCKVASPDTVNKKRFKAECWDPAQHRIVKLEGNWQTGAPGETLPIELLIGVIDDGGHVVPNIPVEFLPDEGEVDPPTANTDPDGKAKTKHTLGPDTGRQKVKVVSPTTENSTTFIERAK
jgi:hypothetical protein